MMTLPHNIEYKDFRINGRNIILDVACSEFFDVEPVVLDILRYGGYMTKGTILKTLVRRYCPEEINNAIQKVTDWRKKGFFPDKDKRTFQRSAEFNRTVLLNVVHDCNLRCRYCYARNYMKGNDYMRTEIARKSIDFFLNYISDAKYAQIIIFGGEPLLNFPVIKEILHYSGQSFRKVNKRVAFELFTNGTLLNKGMIDLFAKMGVKIWLDIDGPRKIHNFHRPFKDGKGSFEQVERILPLLLKSMEEKVSAVAVLSPFSPSPVELYRYFLRLGFSSFSMQPCLYSFERKFAFKDGDLDNLERKFLKMTKEYARDFKQGRISSIYSFGRVFKATSRGCGVGREVLAIDPRGEIWACHRGIGENRFWLGNIKNGIDPNMQRYYLKRTSETSPICRECWARYFCKGGCPFENLRTNGDIDIPNDQFCRYIQLLVKASLQLMLSLSSKEQKKFVVNFSRRYL